MLQRSHGLGVHSTTLQCSHQLFLQIISMVRLLAPTHPHQFEISRPLPAVNWSVRFRIAPVRPLATSTSSDNIHTKVIHDKLWDGCKIAT